ncbi:hypothetical protein [Heyndrickxia sporothermodurans]|uniref:hypothetical protein n=1 Tax=Heyndrickxia sporothermodurans TaxID=46224 RepID=UPI0035DE12D3
MIKVNVVTIYEGIADQPEQGVLLPNGQVLVHADDQFGLYNANERGGVYYINLDADSTDYLNGSPSSFFDLVTA